MKSWHASEYAGMDVYCVCMVAKLMLFFGQDVNSAINLENCFALLVNLSCPEATDVDKLSRFYAIISGELHYFMYWKVTWETIFLTKAQNTWSSQPITWLILTQLNITTTNNSQIAACHFVNTLF